MDIERQCDGRWVNTLRSRYVISNHIINGYEHSYSLFISLSSILLSLWIMEDSDGYNERI